MERRSLVTLVRSLDSARVRYLIVGGLAVVAHGYVRLTVDVDLVLDPDPDALLRAVEALSRLGYVPRAPVPFEEFADPGRRRMWAETKGLTVFSLFSPQHKATEIDLFLECPFDFEAVHSRAIRQELDSGEALWFVSKQDLLEMKRAAGRPRDLQDIEKLLELETPDEGPNG